MHHIEKIAKNIDYKARVEQTERSRSVRMIDADALIEKMRGCFIDSIEENIAVQIINSAPSIDIVRCKECKYKQQCQKAVEHITHEPTSVTIGYKSVEWCSYGEKEGK